MSILSDVANIAVPIEFVLFGLTLVGVAVFHHRTLRVSLIGLGAIVSASIVTRQMRAPLRKIEPAKLFRGFVCERLSRVNEQIDFFRQRVRDLANDVAAKQIY